MEFRDVVRHRRMVRNYTEDPVDPEVVDRILSYATKTPSAGFAQGQSFVVITDPEIRHEIARLAGEDGYVARGFDPWISRAPVHVILCTSERLYHDRYTEPDKAKYGLELNWPVPYWWIDAGAALMMLLLATVEEGLAAGFLGIHSIPDLRELLDIPEGVAPVGVITLGHAAPDRRSQSLQRGRRPHDEIIHRERW